MELMPKGAVLSFLFMQAQAAHLVEKACSFSCSELMAAAEQAWSQGLLT